MRSITRPVRRETATTVRSKPIIIELHPWGIRLREKGRRYSYDVDFRTVYDLACKMAARSAREEKMAQAAERKRT